MQDTMKVFSYQDMCEGDTAFDAGELIQIDVEKNLDQLLGIDPNQIKVIIVVGAWRGNEVESFLRFPNAKIYCFEPNKKNFNHLVDRWGFHERVFCFEKACSSFDGEAELFEASLTGNDSLLEIKEDSKNGLKLIKKHKIQTVKLDSVPELMALNIDLLWADTQGYELEVLSGATRLLQKTKALFLEVYEKNGDYKDAVPYEKIKAFLAKGGFTLVSQGLNEGGGNAFFLKRGIQSKAYQENVFQKRIKQVIHRQLSKKAFLKNTFFILLLKCTPIKVKTLIRKHYFKVMNLK